MRRLYLMLLATQIILSRSPTKSETDNHHDIIYPSVHYTNHDRQRRQRREVENEKVDKTKMNVNFTAMGRKFRASLNLNKRLFSPNFRVEVLGDDGKVDHVQKAENCFYTGKLDNEYNSLVALSSCNGLKGVIQTPTDRYSIQPFQQQHTDSNRPHIVKRMLDDLDETLRMVDDTLEDLKLITDREKRSQEEPNSFCGIGDESVHVRWTRGIMSEKLGEQTIETMLTIDQKMAQYYGIDAAKQYALTVANTAHGILRDSSIGPNTINMIITKLVILTTAMDELTINHHAQNSLESFGRWADKRNNIAIGHPDHYDYSVLLTKHDICVDQNQPCETKGLSYVGGMCDHSRSVAIIEDDGFGSAFTLAHQTGHSLGMDHDGTGNTCNVGKHVMANNGGKANEAFHWSPCSIDYLQQFLRREQSNCLGNDPPQRKREDIDIYANAGVIYDADMQCRYAVGQQSKGCYTENDQICAELLCYLPDNSTCVKMKTPVLDGTTCGHNKWCKEAKCVAMGLRDGEVIDGGWAEWSEFQDCSRSCGGGIAYRERSCQSPKPQNGGKFCEGNSRFYAVCNEKPCNHTHLSYRTVQCMNRGEIYVGDRKYNWTYLRHRPESNCDLRCNTPDGKLARLFGHVADGTECFVSGIVGRCVRGECNTVGCDMLLGSTNIIDRCGVCGGDGSLCKDMIDLRSNPLVVSRSIANSDIASRLSHLQQHRKTSVSKAEKKIFQLKHLISDIVRKKCNDNPKCIANYDIYKSIAKKDVIGESDDVFVWVMRTLGCSVSCGRGAEVVRAECRRYDDSTPVSEQFCNKHTKPNEITRACGGGSCPPTWSASDWSECTHSCGGGMKYRSVDCLIYNENDVYTLPTSQCNIENRPRHLAACNAEPCGVEWFAEPYGQCSTVCGRGVRLRNIVCRTVNRDIKLVHPNASCSHLPVPETRMLCNVHNPCPGDGSCGGSWSDPRGTITSPGYPKAYPPNVECMNEIIAPQGMIVKLNFLNMNIPSSQSCGRDFLRVIDGRCTDQSKPSVVYCGREQPSDYTSSGQNLCLKFVSERSSNAAGFMVNYTMREDVITKPVTDICDVNDHVVTAPLGIITSPNYPTKYPRNENCRVTFMSPDESGFFIKIDAFHVGSSRGGACANDYVEISYEDNNEVICGTRPTGRTLRIPSSEVTVDFHASNKKIDARGFVFTFTTEKYASEHGIDIKENHFKDLSAALIEWQRLQHRNNSTLVTTIPMTTRRKTAKKDSISRPNSVSSAISDRDELVKVLLALAKVDPARFVSALKKKQSIIKKGEYDDAVVKKSSIPHPPLPRAMNDGAYISPPYPLPYNAHYRARTNIKPHNAPQTYEFMNTPLSDLSTTNNQRNNYPSLASLDGPPITERSTIPALPTERAFMTSPASKQYPIVLPPSERDRMLTAALKQGALRSEEKLNFPRFTYFEKNDNDLILDDDLTLFGEKTTDDSSIIPHNAILPRTFRPRAHSLQATARLPPPSSPPPRSHPPPPPPPRFLPPLPPLQPSLPLNHRPGLNFVPGGDIPLSKLTPRSAAKIEALNQRSEKGKDASSKLKQLLTYGGYPKQKTLLEMALKRTLENRNWQHPYLMKPPWIANIVRSSQSVVPHVPAWQNSPPITSNYWRRNWLTSSLYQQPQFQPPYSPNAYNCPPKSTVDCRAVIYHTACTTDSECLDLRLGCCQTGCQSPGYVCMVKEI